MAGPTGGLAADDLTRVLWAIDGVVGIGEGIGGGVGVEEQWSAFGREVSLRSMDQSAVVDGNRAGHSHQVLDFVEWNFF